MFWYVLSVWLAGWLSVCLSVWLKLVFEVWSGFLFEEKKKLHLVEYLTTHSLVDCTVE